MSGGCGRDWGAVHETRGLAVRPFARCASSGQTPTRSVSGSPPSPTSNGGRPDLLVEDTAEANGGRCAHCCFACESGRLGRRELVTAGRRPQREPAGGSLGASLSNRNARAPFARPLRGSGASSAARRELTAGRARCSRRTERDDAASRLTRGPQDGLCARRFRNFGKEASSQSQPHDTGGPSVLTLAQEGS